MPLYDYECEGCGHRFEEFRRIKERYDIICPKCRRDTVKILLTTTARDWFRPGWWEDFDVKPIYVETKGQLKELCKQYGVYSRALD